jgi:hypothetical protein
MSEMPPMVQTTFFIWDEGILDNILYDKGG